MEELRYALPIVTPPDHLTQYSPDIDYFNFAALGLILPLGQCVGHNQLLQCALHYVRERIATQNAVCDNRIHFIHASLSEMMCCQTKCATGIGHIIDHDRRLTHYMP